MADDDGATTRTAGSSAVLAAAIVGGDLAEQRALRDVKQRLFGKTADPVRIGRYALLEKLGSGGLGVVYLARDPELDRRVAIKLMRSSSSQQARHLARFVREARSMAQVSHPNVVEVFDVGSYDVPPDWPLSREAPASGVFIAMAYVDGGSLREWLTNNTRAWRRGLDLLLEAGRGLAAAHAAGLCHRDFKPANVLIGSDGRPRVVDFGLARLVEHGSEGEVTDGGEPLTSDPSITATGAIVGTPAYMAPEQHRGEEVGPAADQFAFCVTAFEALYGRRPFTQKNISALAIAKLEGDIATVRNATGVPAAVQRVLVRGMSASPGDRYASMNDLLAALDRAAHGRLPRWGVAAIPVVALAVIAGLVVMQPEERASQCETAGARFGAVWGPEQAMRVEEAFAATGVPFAANASARVSGQLDAYADGWLAAHDSACASATSDDVTFDRGVSCLARRLTQVETLVGALADADARVVERAPTIVGSLPAPAECLDDDASGTPRPDSPELLVGIFAAREQLDVASTLRKAGRFAEARKKASAVLVDAASIGFDPLQAEALAELGACEGELGDYAASERLISEAYYLAERSGYDKLSADAATLLVAVVADSPKRFHEAERWAEHARAALERSGGPPAARGRLLSVTASMNYRAGRMDAAIADARAAKDIYEDVDHDGDALATALANLGGFLAISGHGDEGEPVLRRSLEIREELLGPQHPSVAQSVNALATVYAQRGEHAKALELQQRALRIWEASVGPEHPNVAMGLGNVATSQSRTGDFEAAEGTARRALALREAQLAEDHVDVGFSRIALAEILLHRQKLDEAADLAERGLTTLTAAVGNDHQYVAFANIVLAQVNEGRGELEASREHWTRAVAVLDETPDDPLFGEAHAGLGSVLLALGDPKAAAPELELAVEVLKNEPSTLPRVQDQLARALWHDPALHARARELARVALNGYGRDTQPDAETRRNDLRLWLEAHTKEGFPTARAGDP